MQTLADLIPLMRHLGAREAIRWTNGFRTTRLSYSDLVGRIGACVAQFESEGLRQGDRLVIVGRNRPEWAAVFWACTWFPPISAFPPR